MVATLSEFQRSSSRHLRHADRKTQRFSGGQVLPSPSPTWARRPRPLRVLASFALAVATIIGPACHDATGPSSSLVPVPSFTIVSGNGQTGVAGSELAS